MGPNLTVHTLILAIGALAVAGYAVLHDPSVSSDADRHLGALEERLARLEETCVFGAHQEEAGPHLRGCRHGGTVPSAPDPAGPDATTEPTAPGETPEDPKRIEELVEETVEKKAAQMQVMRDKKPSIDVFAKTLELTDGQRWEVEQEVLQGQRAIYALLETPTADGALLMDDLVDILAHDIAQPDGARERWARFIGRLLSEKVPGTDETYAVRAEAAKGAVRRSLARNLSTKQCAAFEAWQLDPTEIREIEGSPWKGLEPRVRERAQALAAERPDEG